MVADKLGSDCEAIATQCGIHTFPIYLAIKRERKVAIAPASCKILPTVVEPSAKFIRRQALCRRFHDLYIIDRNLTLHPKKDKESASSFLLNILRAVARIGSAKETTVENVFSSALDVSTRNVS
jgi:hypothetical protein